MLYITYKLQVHNPNFHIKWKFNLMTCVSIACFPVSLFNSMLLSSRYFYTAPLPAPSALSKCTLYACLWHLSFLFFFPPAISISKDASLLMAFALIESDLIYILLHGIPLGCDTYLYSSTLHWLCVCILVYDDDGGLTGWLHHMCQLFIIIIFIIIIPSSETNPLKWR